MAHARRPTSFAPRRQRGAAAVFVAASLVGLLTAVGFALELGQIYAARADLRKQAELAALDAVTAAGGCLSPEESAQRFALADAAVVRSLAQNGTGLTPAHTLLLGVEQLNGNRRQFASLTSATNAHAASVRVQRPLPPQLVPFLPRPENNTMQATAHATRAPFVVFSVGSFLADVDLPDVPLLNNLFEALLGADPGLSALGYRGLLESSVSLVDIAASNSVTSVQTLLAEPVTLPGLLSLLANTLIDTGDAVAAGAIDALANVAAPTPAIPFGEFVGLPPGVENTAQGARIQTFELVRNAALNASPVFQLTPGITLPAGLASVTTDVQLIQPPSIGAGPVLRDESGIFVNSANNQQADINVGLSLALPGLPLANVTLRLEAAEATATLVDTHCANADDPFDRVAMVAETQIATLRIDDSQPILNFSIPLPLIGSVSARVFASAEAQIGSDATFGPELFIGPFSATDPDVIADNTWTVSSPVGTSLSNLLGDLADDLELRTEVDLPVLGPLVANVVNPVLQATLNTTLGLISGVLGGVLVGLDDALLETLLRTLGVSVGGADITVFSFEVPPPTLIASF